MTAIKEKAPGVGDTRGETQAAIAADTTDNSIISSAVLQEKDAFEAAFAEAQEHAKARAGRGEVLTTIRPDTDSRQRAYSFLLYPDSMNPNAMMMCEEAGLQGCFSPLHDQDRFADGSFKKPHYHGLLYYSGKTSLRLVEDVVSQIGGVRVEPVRNLVGMVRYFCHLDIDPEHIVGDRYKVRYNPDNLVCFGGFDAQSYLRATDTQLAKALAELYAIVRERDFTSYDVFIDYIYMAKPEYDFIMANPHVCQQVSSYIRSRFARRAHDNREEVIDNLLTTVDVQRKQVDTLREMQATFIQEIRSLIHGR